MIHVDVITSYVKLDDGRDYMDLGAHFGGEENNGKATQTFRRGNVTVAARSDFAPVFIHIVEADTIDNVFQAICRPRAENLQPTSEQADHALRYCLDMTREILLSAQQKRLDELKPENVELAVH